MKVGVLEILSDSIKQGWFERMYNIRLRRQYASITPQAVAAWCRQLGHNVYYATYYGQQDPKRLLPDFLDIIFIATCSNASPIAYALAKLYRKEKTLTIIGGAHARSFASDCLRFCDLVVQECDKNLIEEILKGSYDRNTIVTSGRRLKEIPSVEERVSEISTASFNRGRPVSFSIIPILTSIGCPYRCDFCVDWKNPYVLLPSEQVAADLSYISEHLPGVTIGYHDSNFGVKFDQVMDTIESLPKNRRNPYVMESSLSILQGGRMQRLFETNCSLAIIGLDAWSNYHEKAGIAYTTAEAKLKQAVAHLKELYQYVQGIQVNFIFGTDADKGDKPFELTKEFLRQIPFVWPSVNIPIPFGGTPLYDRYISEGRLLRSMPFSFYFTPYLVNTLKNYYPLEYYEKLIEVYKVKTSAKILMKQISCTSRRNMKSLHIIRNFAMRDQLSQLRHIYKRLRTDGELRAFHEGRSNKLPQYYRRYFKEKMGDYGELISDEDMIPRHQG